MLRTVFNALSPAGRRGRLSTLIFHRVLRAPDDLFPGEIHARQFDDICGWVRRWFNVLPLDEATQRLHAGTLPARAMCITFDDGYADNESVALPILQRHGLTATFFVATGFLDGGRMWNDTIIESVRRTNLSTLDLEDWTGAKMGRHDVSSPALKRLAIDSILPEAKYLLPAERIAFTRQLSDAAQVELPTDLMMSSSQVRSLRAGGMQIGAHTMSHPILATLDDAEALREILGSKEHLEDLLGEPVSLFAYPNGRPGEDYLPRNVQHVRDCGFGAAVSTVWGTSGHGDDLFELKRFTPWDRSQLRFGGRLAANYHRR